MKNFDIKRLSPIIYVVSVIILLLVVFKLMIFLIPFVIASMIVYILKPLINFLINKTGINSKFIKSGVLLSFYLIILSIIMFISIKSIYELYNVIMSIINQRDVILNQVLKNISSLEKYANISNYNTVISSLFAKVFTLISDKLLITVNTSFTILSNMPSIILFIMFTLLSSFLIINDEEKIMKFVNKQLPKKWIEVAKRIRVDVISFIMNYLKAQMTLISLCFFELFMGLSIISIYDKNLKYVLLISLIIALVDALPILGTGSILIPWTIISLITSNYIRALSLIILYAVIFLVRQYTEPKLISSKSNMHPLITLIAIYSGYKIFGILGFLYGPIIFTILKIVFNDEIEYGFFKYLINERKNDEVDIKNS